MKSFTNDHGFLVEIITPIISTRQRRTSNTEEYTVKYTYNHNVTRYDVKRVNHANTEQKLGAIGGSIHTSNGWSGICRNALRGDS